MVMKEVDLIVIIRYFFDFTFFMLISRKFWDNIYLILVYFLGLIFRLWLWRTMPHFQLPILPGELVQWKIAITKQIN